MRRYTARLAAASLRKLVNDLEEYRDGLDEKAGRLVDRLAEIGIRTGREHARDVPGTFGTHQMGRYVTFTKETEPTKDGAAGLMLCVGETLFSTWYAYGEERHGQINAAAALEFGTAGLAVSARESFGVAGGQGTNSRYGHENDLVWFIYKGMEPDGTLTGKTLATAIRPTRPMLNAALEMAGQIETVAREVFGE